MSDSSFNEIIQDKIIGNGSRAEMNFLRWIFNRVFFRRYYYAIKLQKVVKYAPGSGAYYYLEKGKSYGNKHGKTKRKHPLPIKFLCLNFEW